MSEKSSVKISSTKTGWSMGTVCGTGSETMGDNDEEAEYQRLCFLLEQVVKSRQRGSPYYGLNFDPTSVQSSSVQVSVPSPVQNDVQGAVQEVSDEQGNLQASVPSPVQNGVQVVVQEVRNNEVNEDAVRLEAADTIEGQENEEEDHRSPNEGEGDFPTSSNSVLIDGFDMEVIRNMQKRRNPFTTTIPATITTRPPYTRF